MGQHETSKGGILEICMTRLHIFVTSRATRSQGARTHDLESSKYHLALPLPVFVCLFVTQSLCLCVCLYLKTATLQLAPSDERISFLSQFLSWVANTQFNYWTYITGHMNDAR